MAGTKYSSIQCNVTADGEVIAEAKIEVENGPYHKSVFSVADPSGAIAGGGMAVDRMGLPEPSGEFVEKALADQPRHDGEAKNNPPNIEVMQRCRAALGLTPSSPEHAPRHTAPPL